MTQPVCASLDVFVDGELDAPSADAFREHLPGCGKCQAGLEERLQMDALAARAVEKAKAARQPHDAKLARRVVLGVRRRMTAALNAATDAALEEWLSGAPAESAPPPPPVEGPGLAPVPKPLDVLREFASRPCETPRPHPPCRENPDKTPCGPCGARRALAAEEALAKARREAARDAFWELSGRAHGLAACGDAEESGRLSSIAERFRRAFAAELGSAP